MQRLSVKLQLACGERSFDELHLQHRMDGTDWRPVRSVRGWKVQGVDRNCHLHRLCGRQVHGVDRSSSVHGLRGRDVFYSSRGLSKLDMHRLSVKLELVCGERIFDELHL
jgi:hypothetical protein